MRSVDENIKGIDLDWLVARLVAKGYEEERAQRAVDYYRIVLDIARRNPERYIAPPKAADDAWHEHILKSGAYVGDCLRVFGAYIHHDPDAFGTDLFWDAWEFTRAAFAEYGVELPARENAVEAAPDDQPLRLEDAGGDVQPMHCVLAPHGFLFKATDDGARDVQPVHCVLVAPHLKAAA